MYELTGEHFVNLNDLSFEQAEEVLRVQKKNKKMKFYEIAIKLGFLKPKISDKYPDNFSLKPDPIVK